MDKQPPFDRAFLIPILFGVLSLFGICLILLVSRFNSPRATVSAENTATPFKYLLIGTEPGISTENIDSTESALPDDPFAPAFTITPSRTKSATQTTTGNSPSLSSTPTRTPGPTMTAVTQIPFPYGQYDDTHPLLLYSGNWSNQVGAVGAYQNTLHVSNTVGSSVSFSFTGQQLRVAYQGAPSLGIIRINIGGLNFDQNLGNGTDEWISIILAQGTYPVTISHLSGGSINIDSIIIPDLSTPTPTATPTSTP